jgi:mono/diheme cytochrome c family protein
MRRFLQGLLGSGVSVLVVCVAGCKALPPPTPLANLNAQQMHGHEVYQVRCASCHYDRRNGALHGPSLRGVFKMDYLSSGAPANDERVTATIWRGYGMMPAFGGKIDAEELDDLMAYLHTL